jgi:thiamine biosynthesis lipoprotein
MSDLVRLALEAMGTRFELVMHGGDRVRLRAAGEEALAEIARLDRQLSRYDRASDISWINTHAAEAPVVVEPRLFELLDRCQRLSAATEGAFDITVGALLDTWRVTRDTTACGARPDEAIWEAARRTTGFEHMRLDAACRTVSFDRRGMVVDLGAAGKGYAIDAAVEVLRGHGVAHALIHGGTSSVHALGCSPDGMGWRIAWNMPGDTRRQFMLSDGALSVSAAHGKAFTIDGRQFGHVIDPRRGHPATAAHAAVVTGPASFECDALSTALLVQGASWVRVLRARFSGYDGDAQPARCVMARDVPGSTGDR